MWENAYGSDTKAPEREKEREGRSGAVQMSFAPCDMA